MYNIDYGYSPGIGVSYAMSLGEDRLFSYRLDMEYYKSRGQGKVYSYDMNSSQETVTTVEGKRRIFSVVNIFEFGLYRSKHLRFWVGPHFTVNHVKEKVEYQYNDTEVAIGPVIGLNYNINDSASLSIDASTDLIDSGENLSVRAYVFWRFGEEFKKRSRKRTVKSKSLDGPDIEEKLLYIKNLRDKGIITDDEYEHKRKAIIEQY